MAVQSMLVMKRHEFEESFRFDNDLAFLSEVARRLAPLAARPNLTPEDAKAIERAAAALKKLPAWTPEINVQIEVAHRMGGEEFSESYSYVIRLDRQGVEISSSGSQYDPAVGPDSFSLESLKWYATGQVEQKGNRDTWLERLSYALARNYTLTVTVGQVPDLPRRNGSQPHQGRPATPVAGRSGCPTVRPTK